MQQHVQQPRALAAVLDVAAKELGGVVRGDGHDLLRTVHGIFIAHLIKVAHHRQQHVGKRLHILSAAHSVIGRNVLLKPQRPVIGIIRGVKIVRVVPQKTCEIERTRRAVVRAHVAHVVMPRGEHVGRQRRDRRAVVPEDAVLRAHLADRLAGGVDDGIAAAMQEAAINTLRVQRHHAIALLKLGLGNGKRFVQAVQLHRQPLFLHVHLAEHLHTVELLPDHKEAHKQHQAHQRRRAEQAAEQHLAVALFILFQKVDLFYLILLLLRLRLRCAHGLQHRAAGVAALHVRLHQRAGRLARQPVHIGRQQIAHHFTWQIRHRPPLLSASLSRGRTSPAPSFPSCPAPRRSRGSLGRRTRADTSPRGRARAGSAVL